MAKDSKFPLKVVLTAIDRVTGPLRKVAANLKSTFGTLGKKLAKVGLGIAAVGTLAAVALARMVNSVAESGDEIAKFSARFGIGIAALQEYRFAADRVGTSQGIFNKSLGAFVKRVGEAKIGTGALVTFLNKADPALLRVLKSTKGTEEALEVMFGALGRIEDPTKRAALAAAGFSRAGIAMVNFVTDGADGLKLLRQRARDLGLVMSDDAAKGSEAFVDAQTDVSAVLLGLKVIIGAKLIPTLTDLSNQFVEFVVKNQDRVRKFAQDLKDKIPGAIQSVRDAWESFLTRVRPVSDFFADLVARFGFVDTALALLATTLTVLLAPAFFAAAAAALQFSIAVTANPFSLLVFLILLAVSALAALVIRIRLLGVTWTEMWLGMKLVVFDAIDGIRDKFSSLADSLPDWLIKVIRFGIPGGALAFASPSANESLAAPVRRELFQSIISREILADREEKNGKLLVEFKNAPEGLSIESVGDKAVDFLTQSGFGSGL
jgi:hypothetical protein